MILDFGKFNGWDVAEVDPKYLIWLERTRTAWLNEFREVMRTRGLPTSDAPEPATNTASATEIAVENLSTNDISELINTLIAAMVKRQG